MASGTEQQRKALFTVPYTPGTLKVVGVNGGVEVAKMSLQTVQKPAKLHLVAGRMVLQADGEDLAFITVESEDEQGRLQTDASDQVQFMLSGPGAIVAVGNAEQRSVESNRGDHRALYWGRALVVVRASKKAGEIRLTATSPGLSKAQIAVRSEAGNHKAELQ